MSVLICFALFLGAMIACMITGVSMTFALLLYMIPLCYGLTKKRLLRRNALVERKT